MRLRFTPSTLSLLLSLCVFCFMANAEDVKKEFIYEQAPFPSAHASTVVEVNKGEYLAAWFGGTAEGNPDVAIWASRRTSSGWSKPEELAREVGVPCWNPVFFHTKSGRLWLYYKFGPNVREWTAGRRYSDDEGKTWSKPEHLPAGVYGPIRAKPLLMPDGSIVSGTSVESYQSWAAWVERSTDNGLTWTRTGPVTLPELRSVLPTGSAETHAIGLIQPSVISLGGKHLRMYMRSSTQIGKICIADSNDGGLTWTDARKLDIPNPNSGIDAVRLKDGRIVLIYNDTPSGRTPLNLAISTDGEHFRNFSTLESEPGEFSYPALIQGSDGDLHITYTYKRKMIRYVVFPLASIPK
jgi:predicted neuraminidase